MSWNLLAQTTNDQVVVTTSERSLVSHGGCGSVVWNNYGNELDYAQVTVVIKYCQQYATYEVPSTTTQTKTGPGKWIGKTAPPGSVLKGYHYGLITEQEIFVQTLSPSVGKAQIEDLVLSQCRDWVETLPETDVSENLPVGCHR